MAELQLENTIDDIALKMGYRSGGRQGITVPATNADYVHRLGGAFVYLTTGGVARVVGSTQASIAGWLCMSKETTNNARVQLDGKAYFVITDPSAVFEVPFHGANASVGASMIGMGVCLINHPTSGTTQKQQARIAASNKCATPLLVVRDVDKTNKTVFVSLNPNRLAPYI